MKKVAVFGSFVVDLMARSPHLPVPGETVKGSMFKMGPGGKGFNQCVAAHKAGADVVMMTKIGTDTFANVSVPIFVIITTSAPALCAATHWLNPFPPGPILNIEPFTVSPGTGRCGDLAIRSTTKLPNTATFFILFFLFLFSGYFLLSHFESGFFYLFSF